MEKALEMAEGPARDAYIRIIATYMKVALLSRSGGAATLQDGAASDQVVFNHLAQLSNGKLKLSNETTQLMSAQAIVSRSSISNASQSLYNRKKKKKIMGKAPMMGLPQGDSGGDGPRRKKKKRRR